MQLVVWPTKDATNLSMKINTGYRCEEDQIINLPRKMWPKCQMAKCRCPHIFVAHTLSPVPSGFLATRHGSPAIGASDSRQTQCPHVEIGQVVVDWKLCRSEVISLRIQTAMAATATVNGGCWWWRWRQRIKCNWSGRTDKPINDHKFKFYVQHVFVVWDTRERIDPIETRRTVIYFLY